jgi:hypothetical protein
VAFAGFDAKSRTPGFQQAFLYFVPSLSSLQSFAFAPLQSRLRSFCLLWVTVGSLIIRLLVSERILKLPLRRKSTPLPVAASLPSLPPTPGLPPSRECHWPAFASTG